MQSESVRPVSPYHDYEIGCAPTFDATDISAATVATDWLPFCLATTISSFASSSPACPRAKIVMWAPNWMSKCTDSWGRFGTLRGQNFWYLFSQAHRTSNDKYGLSNVRNKELRKNANKIRQYLSVYVFSARHASVKIWFACKLIGCMVWAWHLGVLGFL